MKNKRVFIASSSELKRERMVIVDFLQDLNDDVYAQGIRYKPVLWEYMDSSMGEKHKEAEYLEKLRQCEICLVLFWRTLGEYTKEELDVAVEEMAAGRLPKKVYVLYKIPADSISQDLHIFKQDFTRKYPNILSFTFENTKILRNIANDILTKNC